MSTASNGAPNGGRLWIIGLGPGDEALLAPAATAALGRADEVIGYAPYVARVAPRPGLNRHPSDNRVELDRARHALTLAAEGRRVAVVSGGDPGIFAMASAVFEAVEHGPAAWRDLDIEVIPGISAMMAAAARIGAPLGHDFCVLSLSDNLKPWTLIEQRLAAAAGVGLAIALYNPISKARPWQLDRAFDLLRQHLPASVPVLFARNVSRPGEELTISPLGAATGAQADMRTLVIIGTTESRLIDRGEDRQPWLYAPRTAGMAP